MSSGGPDLFVICKSCGSEVSPYITECPYCGTRLRKRAPKIDRDGKPKESRRRRRRRHTLPSLPPLRAGEIPGIAPDRRAYMTLALVLGAFGVTIAWKAGAINLLDVAVVGKPGHEWWRLFTAPFAYDNTGYEFAALGATAVFGWLIERRHGFLVVAILFFAGGAGGMLVAAASESVPIATGGNGAALALLGAWVVPDLLELRRGGEIDGDLIGVAAIAAVLLLIPLPVDDADWLAGAAGLAIGLALGVPLARLAKHR
jgi:membrane associated rhomboid family serine protease